VILSSSSSCLGQRESLEADQPVIVGSDRHTSDEWDFSRANPWPELVLAMLSVNNFPLSKTLTLWEGLRKNGLFNPHNYLSWSEDEIARGLVAAGYDRGEVLTHMFVMRLASLKRLCADIDSTENILTQGNQPEIASLLAQVKGVGPRVLENFLLLRGRRVKTG
jgi:3-methyladenine DNA glycosylase/8-oxoguanine DNA glycosylase